MQYRKTWLILLLVALMALWGCSDDDDDDPITPTETAFEVFATAAAAYINDNTDCPGVIRASDLHDNLDDYTVIDVRREEHYLAGHIPGAYHSALTELVDNLPSFPSDKPYVVTCYTGQSAGFAKFTMEMLGYEEVKSLKFGMSSWNSTLSTSMWSNIGDNLTNPETTNNNASLTEHAFPTLLDGYTAGTVVATRATEVLEAGYRSKSYASIKDNLDDYFIINYHSLADYEGTGSNGVPGHIPGAFQFTPYQSLGMDQMLKHLPTDMPIITYCWTGQHSSQVTAYLTALGYDAYNLPFGANHLYHSSLTANAWGENEENDYELEMGPRPSAEFAALVDELTDYVNDSADCPGVISAAALHGALDDYEVIDIRQAQHYDAGHIEGAINSSLTTLLADVAATGWATDQAIAVVCYSGQSAGHAKIALELVGYENVKTVGFGMCSWNSTLSGSWNNNTGNNLAVIETENNNGDLLWHDYPTLDSYDVADRVDAMLAGGFKSIAFSAIQDNLDDYFIMNYFGEADYLGEGDSGVPGHIPGAFQFTPYQSLGWNQMLANLPTDQTIVVYCWTGQHSSQVTAYLNMLGYDAVSLSFGSNGLFYDSLTAHKWTEAAQNDFPLVTTAPVLAAN